MKLVTVLATLAFAFAVQANETKPAAPTQQPAATTMAAPAEAGTATHTGMNAKKKKVAKAGKAAGGEVKKDEKTH